MDALDLVRTTAGLVNNPLELKNGLGMPPPLACCSLTWPRFFVFLRLYPISKRPSLGKEI